MNQETKNGKRAVLYARTATKKHDGENGSIRVQLEALRGFAKERGYQVVAEFVDEATGGHNFNRPSFTEMIKILLEETSKVDTILVWNNSRFSRRQHDSFAMREMLRSKGVDVISINELVDDSLESTLLREVIDVLDDFDRKSLAEDVRAGMEKNVKHGFRNGGEAPFGYRMTKVRDGHDIERPTLEIDEENAPFVQQIFNMSLKGRETTEIAEALNTQGVQTGSGNRWNSAAVCRILSNEVYAGVLVWGKTHTIDGKRRPSEPSDITRRENSHPAIVDREIFMRVQTRLRVNRSHR